MQIHQQREERARLQQFVDCSMFGEPLTMGEESGITDLWRTARHHPSNSLIDGSQGVRLITSGWAGWMRFADDGRRLIYLFLMPGDFIVPGLFTVRNCDLCSLTPVRTVDASGLIEDGGTPCPQASAMIQRSGLRYRHLLLDHMTRLMIGSTTSSIALLLGEFHERSVRSGACTAGRFSLPIGQRMLAAALGRSAVQVNKVLSRFQADGLIRVGYDWLELIDHEGLRSLSGVSGKEAATVIPLNAKIA